MDRVCSLWFKTRSPWIDPFGVVRSISKLLSHTNEGNKEEIPLPDPNILLTTILSNQRTHCLGSREGKFYETPIIKCVLEDKES